MRLTIQQEKGKKKAGFSFGVADSDDDELGAYSATTSSPAGTPRVKPLPAVYWPGRPSFHVPPGCYQRPAPWQIARRQS